MMSILRSVSRVHRLGQQLHRLTLTDSFQHRCLTLGSGSECHYPTSSVLQTSWTGWTPTAISLSQTLPDLAASHTKCDKMGYICPSRLSFNQPAIAILDKSISGQGVLDCPTFHQALRDVIAPEGKKQIISDPISQNQPEKKAKMIMHIRRRRMNRHSLKKYRLRMLFTHRKQNQRRDKKKRKIFEAKLNEITKKADEFDAEQYIRDELDQARRGGFYINVLESGK